MSGQNPTPSNPLGKMHFPRIRGNTSIRSRQKDKISSQNLRRVGLLTRFLRTTGARFAIAHFPTTRNAPELGPLVPR